MPSDLDILIDYYQWEIVRIKELIEVNLKQHFYKEVEFDEKALGYAQRELDRLLELKNPSYSKIRRIEFSINQYERMWKNFSPSKSELMSSYFKPKIDALKKELIELRKLKEPPSREETQLIDEAIYNLISNGLNKIKIHLSIERKLFFQIHKINQKTFLVTFNAEEDELLWFYKYSDIKNHDFKINNDKRRLLKNFILNNPKDILPLKNFLSRIIIQLKPNLRNEDSLYLELIAN